MGSGRGAEVARIGHIRFFEKYLVLFGGCGIVLGN